MVKVVECKGRCGVFKGECSMSALLLDGEKSEVAT